MHINENLEILPDGSYERVLTVKDTVFTVTPDAEVVEDIIVRLTFSPPLEVEQIVINGMEHIPVGEGYLFPFYMGTPEAVIKLPFDDSDGYELEVELDSVILESEPPTFNVTKTHPFKTIIYPEEIFYTWTREKKAAIGIYEVEHDPIPEGFQVTDWSFILEEDHARGTPTLEPIPSPEALVPQTVSRAQGKAALIMGGLWSSVVNYAEGLEDEMVKLLAQTALYDTQEWRRDSPFLTECAQSMGLTEEDLDNLFITASGILL